MFEDAGPRWNNAPDPRNSAENGWNSPWKGGSSSTSTEVADKDGRSMEQEPIDARSYDDESDQTPSRGSTDDARVEPVAWQDGSQEEASPANDGNVTTVMVRNLPGHMRRDDFASALDESGFAGYYDFLYMPSSLSTGRRQEYAFVNFHAVGLATEFTETWHNTQRFGMRGRSRINVSVAVTQGLDANVGQWFVGKTSRIKSLKYWPLIQAERIADPDYKRQVMEAFSDSIDAVGLASPPSIPTTPQASQYTGATDVAQEAKYQMYVPTALSGRPAPSVGAHFASPCPGTAMEKATSLTPQFMPQDTSPEAAFAIATTSRSLENPNKVGFSTGAATLDTRSMPFHGCEQRNPPPGVEKVMAFVLDAHDYPAYIGTCHQLGCRDNSMQELLVDIPRAEGSEFRRMCMYS